MRLAGEAIVAGLNEIRAGLEARGETGPS
jgi:hypothetical protein